MKLNILNSGIVEPIKYNIQDTKNDLNRNKYITLSCPSSFSYASYISDLRSKTNKFIEEIEKISNLARNHEDSYDDLFYSATRIIDAINDPNIKPRKGLANRVEDLATYDITTGSFKDVISEIDKKRAFKAPKVEIPKMKMKG